MLSCDPGIWQHSCAACTAFGAVLATIENSEENALVSSLGGESLWIGLSRASSSPYASESFWAVGGAVPHFHPTEIGQRQRYEIITETTQMAMPKTLAMAKAFVYDNLIKKQMGNGGMMTVLKATKSPAAWQQNNRVKPSK